jgi:transcriptional regulator with XRE-family HTH domain
MTKQQTIRNLIQLSGCRTIKEFAQRHEIPYQRVSEWQRGIRNICNEKLQEIANKEGYLLTIEFKLEKL